MAGVLGTAEMKILCLIVLILLIIGPFRRAFFGNWRFNVPALLGGLVALLVTSSCLSCGDPPWLPLAAGLFVAVGAGAAAKAWLDDVLGKDK